MPTEIRLRGLRVEIYTNDHRPAHVHVNGKGRCAVFHLNCPMGPPELREVRGFSLLEMSQLVRDLLAFVPRLCRRWGENHGH